MSDYKQRLAHYNDTEMYEYCMKDVEATSSYVHTVQRDARFFNRLTLLVLVAVALWLSVLPGVVSAAVIVGLLIVAVNNVEGDVGMNKILTVLAALTVVGCVPSTLEVSVASYMCRDRGGLYELKNIAVKDLRVVCNDNSRHSPEGVVIPPEYLTHDHKTEN